MSAIRKVQQNCSRGNKGKMNMKRTILTLALGLGAIGLLGMLPSQVKAAWPNGYVNSFRVGPYAYLNAYGSTFYRYGNTNNASAYMYYTAPAYSTSRTPYSMSQQWMSRGALGWSYNPVFGLNYTVTTPAVMGYSYSPFYGYYQPYALPSQTYTVPAGYVIP